MARVTVEDCILNVPDRFDLVLFAAQRTRDINSGASLTLPRDGDKNAVIALREIAKKSVSLDAVQKSLLRSFQRHLETEEIAVSSESLLEDQEKAWIGSGLAEQEIEQAGFSEEVLSKKDTAFESDDLY